MIYPAGMRSPLLLALSIAPLACTGTERAPQAPAAPPTVVDITPPSQPVAPPQPPVTLLYPIVLDPGNP
jgi:hypothetical protein